MNEHIKFSDDNLTFNVVNFSDDSEWTIDLESSGEQILALFEKEDSSFESHFADDVKSFSADFSEVQKVEVPVDGGTTDHSLLSNRDAPNQHPIAAISGLKEELAKKQPIGNYLTNESDPTVPAWAKKPTKPTYNAKEVGALPDSTKIPSKTSELTNDSGFATEQFVRDKINEAEINGGSGESIDLSAYAKREEIPKKTSQLENDSGYLTGFNETDPTVPAWAKAETKPKYTASEVGADPSGSATSALKSAQDYTDKQIAAIPTPDVSGQISTHNTAVDAHNDIRLLVLGLTERLNVLANSDDTTLDQMAEIVSYIKDNRELIEQITTGKVSVSDIIDNLTTNASNKPLSAARGVELKLLIDSLSLALEGKLNSSSLTDAINSALAQAKESGEFDGQDGYTPQKGIDYFDGEPGTDGQPGKDGQPGSDGITPHVGENGNWYTGETDTGVPATGPAGSDGKNWLPVLEIGEDGHLYQLDSSGATFMLTETGHLEVIING